MLIQLKTIIRDVATKYIFCTKFWRKLFYTPIGTCTVTDLQKNSVNIWHQNQEVLDKNRILPLSIDQKVHWKFNTFKSLSAKKQFVIIAQNWFVWGNQGCVITDKGYVLSEVSKEYDNLSHSVFKQYKLIIPKKIKGITAVLAASGASVFYHWMVDILPRIQLLKDSGHFDQIDKFILNYQGLTFQKEALKKLGIPIEKLIICNGHWDFHYEFETLIIPSFVSPLNVVSVYTINFLQQTFLKSVKKLSSNDSKLYIKRINGRRILNETEIENFLLSIGFRSILLENYTIEEQALLFQNSNYIIGPHGAGFTNLVFCKSGTTVIDIFSPLWVNPCYWTIANELNLDYRYIIGEGNRPNEGTDLKGKGENILLNLDKLKELMYLPPLLLEEN